jgi:hypothetical protein
MISKIRGQLALGPGLLDTGWENACWPLEDPLLRTGAPVEDADPTATSPWPAPEEAAGR